MESAAKVLELYWDEEAMGMKLAAEFELLKLAIQENDLVQGQKYYDDIMEVTSLKGNENLAKNIETTPRNTRTNFLNQNLNNRHERSECPTT